MTEGSEIDKKKGGEGGLEPQGYHLEARTLPLHQRSNHLDLNLQPCPINV